LSQDSGEAAAQQREHPGGGHGVGGGEGRKDSAAGALFMSVSDFFFEQVLVPLLAGEEEACSSGPFPL
jgi:hypothetical protein